MILFLFVFVCACVCDVYLLSVSAASVSFKIRTQTNHNAPHKRHVNEECQVSSYDELLFFFQLRTLGFCFVVLISLIVTWNSTGSFLPVMLPLPHQHKRHATKSCTCKHSKATDIRVVQVFPCIDVSLLHSVCQHHSLTCGLMDLLFFFSLQYQLEIDRGLSQTSDPDLRSCCLLSSLL